MFHLKFTYVVVTAVGFKKAVIIKQEEKRALKLFSFKTHESPKRKDNYGAETIPDRG